MATPQQLLAKAKTTLGKPAARNAGTSTLYRDGALSRKKTAAPDPNAGVGKGQGSAAGGGGSVMRTFPGFKPKPGGEMVNTFAVDRVPPRALGGAAPRTGGGDQQTINLDGALSKPAVRSAPPPSGPAQTPGAAPAGPPAWQQLQALGVAGQGSAAANRAKLAELQAAKAGAPAVSSPPAPPDHIATQTNTPVLSTPPTASFPGFKPAPGGMDTMNRDPANGRGFMPPPLAGPPVSGTKPGMPGAPAAGTGGFDPNAARGPAGGFRGPDVSGPASGMPAKPLGGAADPAGAVGAPGAGIDGDFSAFGGLARIGAGLQARRRFPGLEQQAY